MVYRVYTEKKASVSDEAKTLCDELKGQLGLPRLTKVRIINRYDAENISEEDYSDSIKYVFSEPQLDDVYGSLPSTDGAAVFAIEYLPGQFDQRADSASQCIQLLTGSERPVIRSAKVYYLYGGLTENDLVKVKKQIINPVESREASIDLPETLNIAHPIPEDVKILNVLRRFTRSVEAL